MRLGSFLPATLFVAILASSAVVSAQASNAEDDEARTLYNLGSSAFEGGRFRAAVDYFQQAYDLSHRPQLLFNIGQAADRLREDQRALDAFEQYLRELPEASNRAVVEARIEILRASIASRQVEAPTTTSEQPTPTLVATQAPSAEPPSGGRHPSTGGVVALGAGGAAVAVGAVFLALGLRDVHTVEDASGGSAWSSVSDAYDRAKTRQITGAVLLGVGAAAATTGLVLVLRAPDDDAVVADLSVRVLPTGLSIQGSF